LDEIRWRDLASKRLVGWLNLRFNRSKLHKVELVKRAFEEAARLEPDHVVITGDVGNLALPSEYELAERVLGRLHLSSRDITIVPGNHDAYVPSAQAVVSSALGPYLTSDDGPGPERTEPSSRSCFPVVRQRGPIALVGCSSALPSLPFVAWGRLGAEQIQRVGEVLERAGRQGLYRVVALHHPVQPGVSRWDNGLADAKDLRRVVAEVGAELILHGHMHRPMEATIAAGNGRAIVYGTGSASLDAEESAYRAQLRVIEISSERAMVSCRLLVHEPSSDTFVPV
jgi:3',5'-cyclic AMP phosphodiesterase CpdA